METLSLAAIAAILASKSLEKIGETIGENVWESSQKLLTLMRKKYPDTIEKNIQIENYGEALIQIEEVIEKDTEVAEAAIELRQAVESEPNQQILIQSLTNVINIMLQEERRRLRNDSQINNLHVDRIVISNPEENQPAMKQQTSSEHRNSTIIGFYLSFLSMILVGLLVFVPISVGIQQVLIALIALNTIFSFSAFRISTRS
ncbi:hypothetical protein IQ259_13060 [Fortiea sp. LEGE XX443]|uniref:hypothetical protein n=1 Tax=Fortiea sp. LEGE XX443 TaxID=1828611 RepID=UPI0018825AED|nr:hypothetical protein [Fortiea sp. LEGE XX443]MBE9005952.1 hypothetical protein [Fortiea sp. LEGE XX443]